MAATGELVREQAASPRNVDGPASPALVLATSRRSLPDSRVIAMLEMLDPEGTRDNIVEEREEVLDV
jgi:hypothetical protein